MNKNIIKWILAVALMLPSSLFVQGCGHIFPDPPVSATFRQSWLTGDVLQIHNRSNNRIVARVYVKNDSKGQSRSQRFSVAPNDMTEVGILEMDWTFDDGEHGHIEIDGYRKKIYFKLLENGRYQIWYGF